MAEEKDITLGDTLITIDDRHTKLYSFGDMRIREHLINGERTFEIPRKSANNSEVKLTDSEGRALYNILSDIYGKEDI